MYGYDELRVSAPYKVGTFKYMVGYNKNNEQGPCRVYIKECQLNVTEGHDESISDVVNVEIKYKVRTNKGNCGWVKSEEIFNTKEELIKSLKKSTTTD
jgi:hypothetical protein